MLETFDKTLKSDQFAFSKEAVLNFLQKQKQKQQRGTND